MTKVNKILHYIEPMTGKLTDDQFILILYLIDWKSAIERGKVITSVQWDILNSRPSFNGSIPGLIGKGSAKGWRIFRWFGPLTSQEKTIVDFVVNTAKGKTFDQLNHLAISTYPAMTLDDTEGVDLPRMAKNYKRYKAITSLTQSPMHPVEDVVTPAADNQ